MSRNIWDYVKFINKKYPLEKFGTSEFPVEDYNSFLAGRAFGHYEDTVLQASMVNRLGIGKEEHFKFLYHTVAKGNRFRPWPKKERFELVQKLVLEMGISEREAFETIALIGKNGVQKMLKEREKAKGGKA